MDSHLTLLGLTRIEPQRDRLPRTLLKRTRRAYDRMSGVYGFTSDLFHSQAHHHALRASGIRDGMRVLEVATGSGEMFRRLVRTNRNGATVGLDLSPNMAARTLERVRRDYPEARTLLQAVDARWLPFRDETFDAVVCCYLLELLCEEDILLALAEFRRVLRVCGTLTLALIGESAPLFNRYYRMLSALAPHFYGRQVDRRVPEFVEASEFQIISDETVRQIFYPSRVLAARK